MRSGCGAISAMNPTAPNPAASLPATQTAGERDAVFDAFRRWGYLQANLDPLGLHLSPVEMPELALSGADAETARRIYCGAIGAEFMHIPDRRRRLWLQQQMEAEGPALDRPRILEALVRAEVFEQ